MACASNINTFVNYSVSYYTGTLPPNTYTVTDLAKWVSYQSYLSPYYGAIPVSLILGQWGFEMGWSGSELTARYNPGNQDSACGYSGSYISGVTTPGKRLQFSNIKEGVTAYANLLIAGYKCVATAYSTGGIGTGTGLSRACDALSKGYDSAQAESSSYCSSSSYAENSSSTKRIWATAGYSGLYSTISSTNNTCLNGFNYIQSTNPGLTGFSNIVW
ncbi:glucosaminidase domain-containing protein [Paenibacillus pini]|uniref:Mannosyl-glycoprotein endo-beta-N-acetylglucosamidase-like domain-containing protein n=1 Tax=Paenibacillus pini JCM 16418 TaxID=1236976 RepID=W7YQ38_9BACL|nr:glucosaminidase domain-containing protein [Paenibacillus pini]GAF09598.1 hypothetical protein JCM16418_3745 [Paenibacillus pini JCM 16418]